MTIYVGKTQNCYSAHKAIAQKFPGSAKVPGSGRLVLYLPEANEDIGHTLVHYYYTGQYQTLRDASISGMQARKEEYRRSVLTYQAAVCYGMSFLEDISRHYIEVFGDAVNIFEILAMAKDVYPRIQSTSSWYPAYLVDRMTSAFSSNEEIFQCDEFNRCFGADPKLDIFMVQIMIKLFSNRMRYLTNALDKEMTNEQERHNQSSLNFRRSRSEYYGMKQRRQHQAVGEGLDANQEIKRRDDPGLERQKPQDADAREEGFKSNSETERGCEIEGDSGSSQQFLNYSDKGSSSGEESISDVHGYVRVRRERGICLD